jgi:hypothetical protein
MTTLLVVACRKQAMGVSVSWGWNAHLVFLGYFSFGPMRHRVRGLEQNVLFLTSFSVEAEYFYDRWYCNSHAMLMVLRCSSLRDILV